MSVFLSLFCLLAGGTSDPLTVDDFACLDQAGVFQRLSENADARFVVLYSYANDCPIARQNASELVSLAADFGTRGVRFLGLDSASQDDRAGIAAQAADLGLTIPILLDDTQCVAEMLSLTRTGEALVIASADWKVRWRGPLDDRLEYGAQHKTASRRYLREALEALLAERAPATDAPSAKGCALTILHPRERDAVEYVRDVAPILSLRCLACHSEGGIGPWAMNGYERVRGWGAMMREVLLQRRMTPWQIDPAYGRFAGDLAIRPDEVRTLVHWVERGAPRGEGEDPLAKGLTRPAPLRDVDAIPASAGAEPSDASPIPEWPLGPPDLVVELPEQEIPATGLVPYRKATVQLDLPAERWVRAVDLRPSNPSVLHHGFAFIRGEQEVKVLQDRLSRLPPERRALIESWLAEKGGSSEKPPPEALQFFGASAFQGIYSFFSKYTPGCGIDAFPAGTGKRLPANAALSFQLHYTTNGAVTHDRPRLGIYFYDSKPARELQVTSAIDTQFVLPPRERAVPVHAERTFDRPVRLYELSPHMHYRGRSMRFTAVLPDGEREVLLSVPEYLFDWQATYALAEPRVLPAGTRIVCDGVFDNSPWNAHNPDPEATVRFGPFTQDEMFIGYLIYSEE